MKPIPRFLWTEANAPILEFVEGKSCHPDMFIPVEDLLSDLPSVGIFSPEPEVCRYVVWYRHDLIFAACTGMRRISLRLSPIFAAQSTALGLSKPTEGLDGWHDFSPFREEFDDWALAAYRGAN